MKVTEIREELHHAIDHADDRLLNLIYAMVKADQKEDNFHLTELHESILDERISDHESNIAEGSSWEQVKERLSSDL